MDKGKIKRIAIRSAVIVALIFLASQDVRLFGSNDLGNPQADDLKVIRQAMAKESYQENPCRPLTLAGLKYGLRTKGGRIRR